MTSPPPPPPLPDPFRSEAAPQPGNVSAGHIFPSIYKVVTTKLEQNHFLFPVWGPGSWGHRLFHPTRLAGFSARSPLSKKSFPFHSLAACFSCEFCSSIFLHTSPLVVPLVVPLSLKTYRQYLNFSYLASRRQTIDDRLRSLSLFVCLAGLDKRKTCRQQHKFVAMKRFVVVLLLTVAFSANTSNGVSRPTYPLCEETKFRKECSEKVVRYSQYSRQTKL